MNQRTLDEYRVLPPLSSHFLHGHARRRAQQRAIPPLVVDWLLRFGAEVHDSHGAAIRYFDRNARRKLRREVGREPVRRLRDKLSCYLVEKDGRIVTIGHRYRRIPHS